MFDKIKTYFTKDVPNLEQKDISLEDAFAWYFANNNNANWSTSSYATSATKGYANNPIVYRCINLRGEGIGRLKWLVVDKDDKEIPNHPLQKLIDHPNTQQSQSEFFTALSNYRDLAGDGYIWANRGGANGVPTELELFRPDKVTINKGNKSIPLSYTIAETSTTIMVDQTTGKSDILNWKLFNPLSDLNGMSPLQAGQKPMDVFNEAENHAKSTLQNGAALSGLFSTEGNYTKEQKLDLKAQLQNNHTGSKNAGKNLFMDGGMNYTNMTSSLKDLLFIELQTEQARYIAQALSVPDQLVGIPGSSTFANFAEARTFFLENTLLPMAESLQESLNMWLTPMYKDEVKIKYDVTSVPGYEERRTELFARLESTTFITTNEKRAQAGLEPIDGGDSLNYINTPTTDDTTTDVDTGDKE